MVHWKNKNFILWLFLIEYPALILCNYVMPICFVPLYLHTCNYVDPVCCVATVCHQVRCMYWVLNTFPCICNLEFPDISCGDLLRVEHRTSLFSCLCLPMLAPNSSGNMQKLGIWDVFMRHSPGKIYLGFGALDKWLLLCWIKHVANFYQDIALIC